MISPVSKSRFFSRRFYGLGVSLNFMVAFALGVFAAAATFFSPPANAADEKAVLVLTQGNGRQPHLVEFMSGFQQTLTTNLRKSVTVYIENLDFQHFNSPEYHREIVEWLRVKYGGRKLDAILSENEQTVELTFAIRAELWPQTPMVFVDYGRMEVTNIVSQTNVTRISAETDVPGTLEAALRLCPNTRRIAFVSSGDNGYADLYRRNLNQVEELVTNRFEVIKLIGLTMAETKQRIATLPPQTIVFYNGLWIAEPDSFSRPVTHWRN